MGCDKVSLEPMPAQYHNDLGWRKEVDWQRRCQDQNEKTTPLKTARANTHVFRHASFLPLQLQRGLRWKYGQD